MMKQWLYTNAVALLGAMLLLIGCGSGPSVQIGDGPQGMLQIKGSDTMVNLVQAWAEAFMEAYPGVLVSVTGGGSGTGIASLFNGTADIASCSRTMSAKERTQAQTHGWTPQEDIVALDGLAVVVHPENPINTLTLTQLADIFTGRITNWHEIGGSDRKIVLLSREVNSGTHVYFKKHVLSEAGDRSEFAPTALLLPSSQSIADEVSNNIAGIGYYGMGYTSSRQKVIAVAQRAGQPGTWPTDEAVRAATYPISRPMFFFTRDTENDLVTLFKQFVLSPEGQAIVPEQDFVAVR
jgi:phosphate transport system substrate-binding protein